MSTEMSQHQEKTISKSKVISLVKSSPTSPEVLGYSRVPSQHLFDNIYHIIRNINSCLFSLILFIQSCTCYIKITCILIFKIHKKLRKLINPFSLSLPVTQFHYPAPTMLLISYVFYQSYLHIYTYLCIYSHFCITYATMYTLRTCFIYLEIILQKKMQRFLLLTSALYFIVNSLLQDERLAFFIFLVQYTNRIQLYNKLSNHYHMLYFETNVCRSIYDPICPSRNVPGPSKSEAYFPSACKQLQLCECFKKQNLIKVIMWFM